MADDDSRRAVAQTAIAVMDLTDLNDERDGASIPQLVSDAVEHRTAAVCVWPEFVPRVVELLSVARTRHADVAVRVATVANFPSGAASLDEVVNEVAEALGNGADEIDLVLPYNEVQRGEFGRAGEMIAAVGELVHVSPGRLLKVILETGELGDAGVIRAAAECAIAHGGDFIKTSTGKSSVSATLDAVDVMLGVIAASGRVIGVKPSGGIRTVADAEKYLELAARHFGPDWASPETFRFGASGLLADALAA